MGDFKKGLLLIAIGVIGMVVNAFTLGPQLFLPDSPYGMVVVILIVVTAFILAAGVAFFERGRRKWWKN